jgi:fibronectin-binding autotransporter adhesin
MKQLLFIAAVVSPSLCFAQSGGVTFGPNQIHAGTNVTITPGAGNNITISATGGTGGGGGLSYGAGAGLTLSGSTFSFASSASQTLGLQSAAFTTSGSYQPAGNYVTYNVTGTGSIATSGAINTSGVLNLTGTGATFNNTGRSSLDNGAITTNGLGSLTANGSGGFSYLTLSGTHISSLVGALSVGSYATVGGSLSVNGASSLDGGGITTDGGGDLTVGGLTVNNVTTLDSGDISTNGAGTLELKQLQDSGIAANAVVWSNASQILSIVPGWLGSANGVRSIGLNGATSGGGTLSMSATGSTLTYTPSGGLGTLTIDRSADLTLTGAAQVYLNNLGSAVTLKLSNTTNSTALLLAGANAISATGASIFDAGLIASDGLGDWTVNGTLTVGGSSSLDGGDITTNGIGGLTVGTWSAGGGTIGSLQINNFQVLGKSGPCLIFANSSNYISYLYPGLNVSLTSGTLNVGTATLGSMAYVNSTGFSLGTGTLTNLYDTGIAASSMIYQNASQEFAVLTLVGGTLTSGTLTVGGGSGLGTLAYENSNAFSISGTGTLTPSSSTTYALLQFMGSGNNWTTLGSNPAGNLAITPSANTANNVLSITNAGGTNTLGLSTQSGGGGQIVMSNTNGSTITFNIDTADANGNISMSSGQLYIHPVVDFYNNIAPFNDNAVTCGAAGQRWSGFDATTGTIGKASTTTPGWVIKLASSADTADAFDLLTSANTSVGSTKTFSIGGGSTGSATAGQLNWFGGTSGSASVGVGATGGLQISGGTGVALATITYSGSGGAVMASDLLDLDWITSAGTVAATPLFAFTGSGGIATLTMTGTAGTSGAGSVLNVAGMSLNGTVISNCTQVGNASGNIAIAGNGVGNPNVSLQTRGGAMNLYNTGSASWAGAFQVTTASASGLGFVVVFTSSAQTADAFDVLASNNLSVGATKVFSISGGSAAGGVAGSPCITVGQTILNGTAGSLTCSMPLGAGGTANTRKEAMIWVSSTFVSGAGVTYTYPTAFTNFPATALNTSGGVLTVSTTSVTVTLASAGSGGWIFLDGFCVSNYRDAIMQNLRIWLIAAAILMLPSLVKKRRRPKGY